MNIVEMGGEPTRFVRRLVSWIFVLLAFAAWLLSPYREWQPTLAVLMLASGLGELIELSLRPGRTLQLSLGNRLKSILSGAALAVAALALALSESVFASVVLGTAMLLFCTSLAPSTSLERWVQ